MKHATRTDPQPASYELHRIRLEQERMELEHVLNEAEERLRLMNHEKADEIVEAGTSSDREFLLERTSQQRQKLKLVLQSLERLRDGSFGRCVGCEDTMGEKRLSAIPFAQYCIDCQEQLERGQITHGCSVSSEA